MCRASAAEGPAPEATAPTPGSEGPEGPEDATAEPDGPLARTAPGDPAPSARTAPVDSTVYARTARGDPAPTDRAGRERSARTAPGDPAPSVRTARVDPAPYDRAGRERSVPPARVDPAPSARTARVDPAPCDRAGRERSAPPAWAAPMPPEGHGAWTPSAYHGDRGASRVDTRVRRKLATSHRPRMSSSPHPPCRHEDGSACAQAEGLTVHRVCCPIDLQLVAALSRPVTKVERKKLSCPTAL